MRRIICILMCLSMASMVSALSITNGDFEALGVREDVPDWFDYNAGQGAVGTYLRLLYSPNGTQYMGLRDGGCWAYQGIGVNTGGLSALQIQYEIGSLDLEISENNEDPPSPAPELTLIVSLYESDGSFEGSDGRDIDGADGVTLIDSVTVTHPTMGIGNYVTGSVTLHYLNTTSGELFLRFENETDEDEEDEDEDDKTDDRFSIDNVQIVDLEPSVVSPYPKDGTEYVAVERTSSENDLIFDIADEDIVAIDVLFAPEDPNVSESDKIVDGRSVSQGQQTITLETEWPEDLDWSTEYFWRVLAYEQNGSELVLKYTSPAWSFKSIQEGPYLGEVSPADQAAHPGDDVEFTVTSISKADTLQWYKKGDPNVVLSDSDPSYSGTTTDTLTIHNVQPEDAGLYFCIGKETSTGMTKQSESSGELWIKQLMTHYSFEETFTEGGRLYTYDVVGNKHMELMNGASLSDENSVVGKHLWLDNPKNQYAQIADITVADYEDITISFWCNATTLVNENDKDRWARIFDFGKDSAEYIFFTMLYRQDDPRQGGLDVARCEIRHPDYGNPELDAEHPDIAAGNWYYVAITIEADDDGEGGRGRIYIGGEHGTETETPQILNVPNMKEMTKTIHYIGKNIGFSAPLFNGRIDEFKIYNYARTSEEIAQDYLGIVPEESLCDMENYDLYDWDYDRNCQIDLRDFAEIAAHWMEDYRVFPD